MTNARDLETALHDALNDNEGWLDQDVEECATFEDCGVLSNNRGLVLTLADGAEFQITIVQSRGAR